MSDDGDDSDDDNDNDDDHDDDHEDDAPRRFLQWNSGQTLFCYCSEQIGIQDPEKTCNNQKKKKKERKRRGASCIG